MDFKRRVENIGAEDEAVQAYRKAIKAKQDHADGFYSLANLKTYKFLPDEIALMDRLAADEGLLPNDAVHISRFLAKAYEDQKAYDVAFRHLEKGNELKRHRAATRPMSCRPN